MSSWVGCGVQEWSLWSRERKSQVRRAVRRGSPAPQGFSRAPQGGTRSGASCLDQGQRFPGYWRTCRGPGCVWSPESTSYHSRPESLLVTHLLPLPKACGLSCLTGDRSFPGPFSAQGPVWRRCFFQNEASLHTEVSPHTCAVNHALPTAIPITKKQQRHLPEASSLRVSSGRSVPSSYTEQEQCQEEGAQT